MGDVAMTVPVIKAVLEQNPGLSIIYVSRPAFAAMFQHIPRLEYVSVNLKAYNGFYGLYKLYRSLKKLPIDAVADLHDHLRTIVLRNFFSLSGIPVVALNKGRREKKQAINWSNKILKPLKPMTERYADVFRELGFPVVLTHQLKRHEVEEDEHVSFLVGPKHEKWVGIAPFAKHKGKLYPLEKMEEVIRILNEKNIRIFLMGGGEQEELICNEWEMKFENVTSIINQLTLAEELKMITKLDVMLSMDSAGMHLASIQGVPVVSIWGATHPYLGFLGYGQSEKDIVGNDISCRPCSIFGKTPCYRPERDFACLNRIEPQQVIDHLQVYLD